MKLYKKVTTKENKQYIDLFLEWSFKGKTYLVRIDPTFKNNFRLLVANAEPFNE